jgi:hypothetical protein
VAVDALSEEIEEGLAVALRVEAFAAVGFQDAAAMRCGFEFIEFGGPIIKTLGAEEEAVHGAITGARESDEWCQRRGVLVFEKAFDSAATCLTKAELLGDGFEQGGFTGAVLANEESDLGVQLESFKLPNGGDGKGMRVPVHDGTTIKREGMKEMASHGDARLRR